MAPRMSANGYERRFGGRARMVRCTLNSGLSHLQRPNPLRDGANMMGGVPACGEA